METRKCREEGYNMRVVKVKAEMGLSLTMSRPIVDPNSSYTEEYQVQREIKNRLMDSAQRIVNEWAVELPAAYSITIDSLQLGAEEPTLELVPFCMRCLNIGIFSDEKTSYCHQCGSEGTCINILRADYDYLTECLEYHISSAVDSRVKAAQALTDLNKGKSKLKGNLLSMTWLLFAYYFGEVAFLSFGVTAQYYGIYSINSMTWLIFYGYFIYSVADLIRHKFLKDAPVKDTMKSGS